MSDSESSSRSDTPRSDASDVEDLLGRQSFAFGREPRFSAEELASRSAQLTETEARDAEPVADALDDVLFGWPPESRVGNTNWCECGGKCSPMPNRLDCLCCQDAAVTLELVRANHVSCVTELTDYEIVILHRGVLSTALRGYFEMKKQPLKPTEEPDNRYVIGSTP